jgi:glycine betaine/proline transport system permease protein
VLEFLLDPFASVTVPLGDWVEVGLKWLVDNFRPFFQAIRWPIDQVLGGLQAILLAVPPLVMIAIIGLIGWQIASRRVGIASALAFLAIGLIGAYTESMLTLAIVLTAVVFCVVIGLPTGIAMARSDRVREIARPILDTMQTTPAFVYLVPIVMLFGIGNVPGVVVTIIFALPPLVRLTDLGIRQVPGDVIEAATAFGASPRQLLFKVQLPLATRTIMAGVNQTLMLALSMVVIASMISVGGLGQMVLRGIGRLDMGLATVGGIGIVLLAIVLDRLTQALAQDEREGGGRRLSEHGPIGALVKRFGNGQDRPASAGQERAA